MGSATRLWSAGGLALALLAACSPTTTPAAASPRAEPNAEPAAVARPPGPPAEGRRTAADATPPPTDPVEAGAKRPSGESPPPTAQQTPRRCGADPQKEQPIRTDELGSGDRMVRVLNRAHGELQVRLVGEDDQPALAGTLLIAPGAAAVFRVPAGHYRLRYRVQTTCEVLRGSAIRLTGRRTGVEIALKPGPRRSPQATVSRVRDDL